MSRVGEFDQRDVGQDRPATGFLAGAAALLGLGRLLRTAEPPMLGAALTEPPSRPMRTPVLRPLEERAPPSPDASVSPADEIDRLCAQIAAAPKGQGRRIVITHAASAEAPLAGLDCAAFASQLARSLSSEGRTILVIFGAGGGGRPGLSELIDGSASFSEAIHREAGSRLHILPSGRGRAAPGRSLNVVIDALTDTYDYVVLSTTDEDGDALRKLAIALAPRADHMVIGCPGQTGSPDVLAFKEALKDEGAGDVVVARIGAMSADVRAAA